MSDISNEKIEWWRNSRFGMFIHWGLYALPAGTWKGREIPGIGEWIMARAKIPLHEYRQLAEKFNPVKFNAAEIVDLASEAGMKYIVITSKHHDGFAMYKSDVSDYNIVDSTPYGQDPIEKLAEECHKKDIKICFYYSQSQDWAHPDAAGNTWDFPDEEKKDFARYLEEKVKPQLRELLTKYGPVGLIWFDTPRRITREQSLELKAFVKNIQPDCLVSGRVGHNVGDYGSMGDNQIPAGRVEGDWETPVTMNDTWGYKKNDSNWKSTGTLLYLLVDLASKGVNFLLNIGPTAEGDIPGPSARRLREIGKWMKTNSDAIYGTKASPFPYEFDWGRITCRGNKMYLLFWQWPGEDFVLHGLKSRVEGASLLQSTGEEIDFEQTHKISGGFHRLHLTGLPGQAPDPHISVIELETDGEADVIEGPIQQPDDSITLPAHMAALHGIKTLSEKLKSPETEGMSETEAAEFLDRANEFGIGRGGLIENWHSRQNRVSWEFTVYNPGEFDVQINTVAAKYRPWKGGHKVRVSAGDRELSGAIKKDEAFSNPRTKHFEEAVTHLGRIQLDEPGKHRLKLKADEINNAAGTGLVLSQIKLVPRA